MHVLVSNGSTDILSSWPPAAAQVGEGSLLQQPSGDTQHLELTVRRKEVSSSLCQVRFISTARTVELLVDEDGTGKFSYLSSCRGTPSSEGLFVTRITLPASVKQAKLRMLSRTGDRRACLVQALQCIMEDAGPHWDASSGSCCQSEAGSATDPSERPLCASAEAIGPPPGAAHQEQLPRTQAAQIRQLLQHAAQPEGASLESLPTSLHHLSQKMAQAVSGSAGGGGMMSQLVQDLARKALLQPTSSPASLQEIQGSRALSQAQLAQDAKEAEQHSLPERLLRLEETMAAIAAAVQRIEGGQHSILQGQQVILSRLERLEHTSVGDVFEK